MPVVPQGLSSQPDGRGEHFAHIELRELEIKQPNHFYSHFLLQNISLYSQFKQKISQSCHVLYCYCTVEYKFRTFFSKICPPAWWSLVGSGDLDSGT